MNSNTKENMFDYYNERAEEYDEIYTLGTGPASIPDPQAYKEEAEILAAITEKYCYGRLIDIACGTGFWLPKYASQCLHITLFEQSPKMLSVCERKVSSLKAWDRCTLLCGDFLEYQFEDNHKFDFALIGFFISHLNEIEEEVFFEKLRLALKPYGKFLIFDSAWNEERAITREKHGKHQRKLNDGRSFEIYKRYFDESDIKYMAKRHQLCLSLEYIGRTFIAILGKLTGR